MAFGQEFPSTSLAKIQREGFQNSKAMEMLSELTDVYGSRLTGSNEYKMAADYMLAKMKELNLENTHFENYCKDCRGWSVKSFNVEMRAPNYMNVSAYPLAMANSTSGSVEGEVIYIESFRDMERIKKDFKGKLKGKIILQGGKPKYNMLFEPLSERYTSEDLTKMEELLSPEKKTTPLPDLLEGWKVSDKNDQPFLEFIEKEGALALLTTSSLAPGILHPGGTYYYREGDLKPLPYFKIMPEQFGRLTRMMEKGVTPKIRLNLETEFYMKAENNVNIIAELQGSDPSLKSEVVLAGGHFDSWHSATGATDNGASCVVILEALRILKATGLPTKRTIRMGLWGGEEQAFLGSVSYARDHYGKLNEKPNADSKKVSAYLNLDNGAGAIRGIYLQGNELARPVFTDIFNPLSGLGVNTLTIENTTSTDHETFDFYGIPAFQFIQDELNYNTVTHHTNLDVIEYVPESDMRKNAVILAYTLYKLANYDEMVPRK